MGRTQYFFATMLVLFGTSQLGAKEATDLQEDFESQVNEILTRRQLKPEDYAAIESALDRIERILQTRWPESKLIPFGSVFTGLGTPDSDIDCYVDIPYQDTKTTLTEEIACIFKQYPEEFADVQTRGNTIPKVSAVYLPSRRKIDVSFTAPISIRNTQLIQYLLSRDSTALSLARIIKFLTKIHMFDMQNTHYLFTIRVIFFLQQKGIFPPISELQKNVKPLILDNWNTAFEERIIVPTNEDLSDLLADFFEYYSSFDYERYLISPFVGYLVSRAEFADLRRLPQYFEQYKRNVAYNLTIPLNLSSFIAVQDLFDHSRSVAIRITDVLAKKMVNKFGVLHKRYLLNHDPSEFLKPILQE